MARLFLLFISRDKTNSRLTFFFFFNFKIIGLWRRLFYSILIVIRGSNAPTSSSAAENPPSV
jgi:hypothetical protein